MSGIDQNQSWCQLPGTDAPHHSQNIKKTLNKVGFYSEIFIETMENITYINLTKKIFIEMLKKDIFYKKITPVYVCRKTGRYLAESEIQGFCPKCDASIRGNNCENCFSFIDTIEISSAKSIYPDVELTIKMVERVYFPLAKYTKIINDFLLSANLSPILRSTCIKLLKSSLTDIPMTSYFPAGIELDGYDLTGQYICYYFEHISRLVYTLNNLNIPENAVDEFEVVRFYGIDNTFMYTIFAPALLYSYNPKFINKLTSNVNQYYLLNNEKFSTSRKNAIWAEDFINQWGVDITRLYLASTRPQETKSSFTHDKFINFCELLDEKFFAWLEYLFTQVKTYFHNKVPEAGGWENTQLYYMNSLNKLVNEAYSSLTLNNFSTTEYVSILMKIIDRANNFSLQYRPYANQVELNHFYRTAIALELSTVHVLAIISWPVIPSYAECLYKSLGFQGKPFCQWSALPVLISPNQKIAATIARPFINENVVARAM